MFKRARWAGLGAALGAGTVIWIQRKLRSMTGRYAPAAMAGDAVERAASLPANLRDAFSEGREAMREREAELRRVHPRPAGRSRQR